MALIDDIRRRNKTVLDRMERRSGVPKISPQEAFDMGVRRKQREREIERRKEQEKEQDIDAELDRLIEEDQQSKTDLGGMFNQAGDILTDALRVPNRFDPFEEAGRNNVQSIQNALSSVNPFTSEGRQGIKEGVSQLGEDIQSGITGLMENTNPREIRESLDPLSLRSQARAYNTALLNIPEMLTRDHAPETNEKLFGDREGFAGIGDTMSDFLGYTAPGAGSYSAARAIPGVAAKTGQGLSRARKAGEAAKEGAVAGGIFSLGESLTQEALQPEDRNLGDHVTNAGINIGLGAGLDAGGRAAADWVANTVRNQRNNTSNPANLEQQLLPSSQNVRNLQLPEGQLRQNRQRIEGSERPLGLNEGQRQLPEGLMSRSVRYDSQPSSSSTDLGQYGDWEAEPLGLPESNADYSTFGGDQQTWQNRLQEFADYARGQNLPPGRERESLLDLWSGFARENEPDLDTVVDLANPQGQPNPMNPGDQPLRFSRERYSPVDEQPVEYTRQMDRPFSTTRSERSEFDPQNFTASASRQRQQPDQQQNEFSSQNFVNRRNQTQNTVRRERKENLNKDYLEAEENVYRQQRKVGQAPESNDYVNQQQQRKEAVNQNFRDGYTKKGDKKKSNNPLDSKMQNFMRNWIDKNMDFKKAEEELLGRNNAYVHKSLTNESGAAFAAMREMERKLSPILGVSEGKQGTWDALEFAAAKQAKDLIENKGWKPGKDLPESWNLDSVNRKLGQFQGNEDVNRAADELQNFFDNQLQRLVDVGYFNEQQLQNLKRSNPNYFPMFRDLETDPESFEQGLNAFMTGGRKNIKSRDGDSSANVNDLLENVVNYTMNMHRLAARTRTNRKIYQMAQKDTEGKYAKIIEPERYKKNGQPVFPNANNAIKMKIDGEDKMVSLEKNLYETIQNANTELERNTASSIVEGVKTLAKIQRVSVVGDPRFQMKEIFRNNPFAWVTSRAGFNWQDWAGAVKEMVGGQSSSEYDQFIRDGGGFTSIWAQDENKRNSVYRMLENTRNPSKEVKEINKRFNPVRNPKDLANLIRRFSEYNEQIPKYAEYKATRRKGEERIQQREQELKNKGASREEIQQEINAMRENLGIDAVFNAREIYDHQMAGLKTEKINPYTAFFNSNIRGKHKLVRAFKENPVRTTTRSFMATAPFIIGSKLSYDNFATDEQKRYMDEAPPFLKEMYYMFPDPLDDTKLYRIPKPFEAHALAGRPLEFLMENMSQQEYERTVGQQMKDFFNEQVMYSPTLNPAMPFIEVLMNRDSFTGQEIVSSFDNREKQDQVDVDTSAIATMMGSLINSIPTMDNVVSPKQVDHIVKGVIPSSGDYLFEATDEIQEQVTGNERPDSLNSLNPFTGGLTYETRGRTSPTVGNFYDTRDDLRRENAEASDNDEPYIFENLKSEIEQTSSDFNQLSQKQKEIENSPDLTGYEKRLLLDDLTEKRNEQTRKLFDAGVTKEDDNQRARAVIEQLLRTRQQ